MDFEESAPETGRREGSGGLRNIHIVQNVPGTDTFFFFGVMSEGHSFFFPSLSLDRTGPPKSWQMFRKRKVKIEGCWKGDGAEAETEAETEKEPFEKEDPCGF